VAALDTVLERIDKVIGGKPTVINSDHGLHILQPIKSPPLESLFAGFELEEPLTLFMRFGEDYLSDNKADPNHNPSLASCWLRIPGSYNDDKEVKVIRHWDGKAVSVLPLMRPFLNSITNSMRTFTKRSTIITPVDYGYRWVERLIKTPMEDGRKLAIWHVLSKYLIKRGLQYDQAFNVIMEWLDKCNELRPLRFNAKQITKHYLSNAQWTRHTPLGLGSMKKQYPGLCDTIARALRYNNAILVRRT
jgi:hypothetical protein